MLYAGRSLHRLSVLCTKWEKTAVEVDGGKLYLAAKIERTLDCAMRLLMVFGPSANIDFLSDYQQ